MTDTAKESGDRQNSASPLPGCLPRFLTRITATASQDMAACFQEELAADTDAQALLTEQKELT